MLAQIRSVCGTTRFDGGKMHDVFFAGMPEQTHEAELTRNSIALASTDSFIYMASLLNISKQFALVDPSPSASYLGARLQRIGQGLAAAGITAEQWTSVFGSEIGASADWKSDSHWPAVLGAFPVKDFAKAKQIAVRLAWILDDDGHWTETDKNGVHYISTPYTAGFLTLRPTIAVSERFMVGGFDIASVEAAMERANNGSLSLSSSAAYKKGSHLLPDPTTMFAYLDLGLLYTRLDATLRPMLLMGAAFMPAMNDYVEVAKLPPAEIVAKHLTPVVSSQRYHANGYISESIGPLTLSQTGVGAMLVAAAGTFGYQHSGLGKLGGGLGLPGGAQPHRCSFTRAAFAKRISAAGHISHSDAGRDTVKRSQSALSRRTRYGGRRPVRHFGAFRRKVYRFCEKTAAIRPKCVIIHDLWLSLRKMHFRVEFPIL